MKKYFDAGKNRDDLMELLTARITSNNNIHRCYDSVWLEVRRLSHDDPKKPVINYLCEFLEKTISLDGKDAFFRSLNVGHQEFKDALLITIFTEYSSMLKECNYAMDLVNTVEDDDKRLLENTRIKKNFIAGFDYFMNADGSTDKTYLDFAEEIKSSLNDCIDLTNKNSLIYFNKQKENLKSDEYSKQCETLLLCGSFHSLGCPLSHPELLPNTDSPALQDLVKTMVTFLKETTNLEEQINLLTKKTNFVSTDLNFELKFSPAEHAQKYKKLCFETLQQINKTCIAENKNKEEAKKPSVNSAAIKLEEKLKELRGGEARPSAHTHHRLGNS